MEGGGKGNEGGEERGERGGRMVAAKVLNLYMTEQVGREVSISSVICHPNIVSCLGTTFGKETILVFPLFSGKNCSKCVFYVGVAIC